MNDRKIFKHQLSWRIEAVSSAVNSEQNINEMSKLMTAGTQPWQADLP